MAYLNFLRQHVSVIGGAVAVYRLLELVASVPDRLAKDVGEHMDELKVRGSFFVLYYYFDGNYNYNEGIRV